MLSILVSALFKVWLFVFDQIKMFLLGSSSSPLKYRCLDGEHFFALNLVAQTALITHIFPTLSPKISVASFRVELIKWEYLFCSSGIWMPKQISAAWRVAPLFTNIDANRTKYEVEGIS